MADADVSITAGAGTKIDTRTVGAGTDEHRQVVVVGDPSTAANVGAVSAAGALKVDGSAVTQPVSLVSVPTVTEKQDQPAATAATWTSATSANTAVTVTTTGYGTANVFIVVPSTTTAGVITIEVSNDGGTTYVPAGAVRVDNGLQESVITLAQTPGIALNRMYAVSVDAMTQVRARLSTVITGAGNVVVTVSTVAGGIEPFVAQRSRKAPTYRAFYRTATRPYNLDFTFTANTRKQYATIHHAATATKTVRLRRARVWVYAVATAAVDLRVDLVRITAAPATGNPAITPTPADTGDAVAEATCLALPTTAGTEGALFSSLPVSIGITGAAPTTSPPPVTPSIDLLAASTYDDEAKPPTIRAGVLEGWAIVLDANTAARVIAHAEIEFTEEAP